MLLLACLTVGILDVVHGFPHCLEGFLNKTMQWQGTYYFYSWSFISFVMCMSHCLILAVTSWNIIYAFHFLTYALQILSFVLYVIFSIKGQILECIYKKVECKSYCPYYFGCWLSGLEILGVVAVWVMSKVRVLNCGLSLSALFFPSHVGCQLILRKDKAFAYWYLNMRSRSSHRIHFLSSNGGGVSLHDPQTNHVLVLCSRWKGSSHLLKLVIDGGVPIVELISLEKFFLIILTNRTWRLVTIVSSLTCGMTKRV